MNHKVCPHVVIDDFTDRESRLPGTVPVQARSICHSCNKLWQWDGKRWKEKTRLDDGTWSKGNVLKFKGVEVEVAPRALRGIGLDDIRLPEPWYVWWPKAPFRALWWMVTFPVRLFRQ